MRPVLISPLLRLLALAVVAVAGWTSPAGAAETPALHIRHGLPKVASRPAALRVAYLGGSITAAPGGWRSLTTDRLRIRFPDTEIVEIAAGLPGTGSDLGACRLERDVLRHRPDLLFVEFAVNDTGVPAERIERTMEGVVRRTWRANPDTDIVFVYTISTPALPDLEAGRFQPSAQAMERVAEHYGIPSLHFGVEVVRRVARGELDFRNPDAPQDARTFSTDGVHPTSSGHRLYADTLEQAFPELLARPTPRPAALPTPLHADNWENARLHEVSPAALKGDWSLLSHDDPSLRGATKHLLPPTWRTETVGAKLEFEFTGTRFGLLGIAGPDAGEFRVTIDDREPVTATLFDAFVTPTFCRQRHWFYPNQLEPGRHRVVVELLGTRIDKAAIKATRSAIPPDDLALYEPHRLTLCGVLTVGDNTP